MNKYEKMVTIVEAHRMQLEGYDIQDYIKMCRHNDHLDKEFETKRIYFDSIDNYPHIHSKIQELTFKYKTSLLYSVTVDESFLHLMRISQNFYNGVLL